MTVNEDIGQANCKIRVGLSQQAESTYCSVSMRNYFHTYVRARDVNFQTLIMLYITKPVYQLQ